MSIKHSETQKKAFLDSLYLRVKNRIKFLGKKRKLLILELRKKSDNNKIQKIKENMLKQ